MNYMPEVLKMLGVEIGEEFKIKGMEHKNFSFDENYHLIFESRFLSDHTVLAFLMSGTYEIEKPPWKPKNGESYYVITDVGGFMQRVWNGKYIDYAVYNAENYFKTKEEITPKIKEQIIREMKEKYENG